MRRVLPFAVILTAACAGRSAAPPSSSPAPAGAPAAAARSSTATGDPSSLRYAGGSSRYRIETAQHTVQEMMGNTTTVDATTMQIVSVVLTPQADGFALRATLDTINVTTSMPGAAEATAAARALMGKSVTGTMAATGRLSGLTGSDTTAAQLVAGMRDFFAVIPAPPLAAGREWTDTITNTQAMGPLTMTSTSTRAHRIAGWEMRDGVRALKVTTTSTYTVSGSGDAQGQPLELSGGGVATAERFISTAGLYLGAVESDSALMNVNVVSMGMTIPVRRSQRTTVTRLP